MYGALVNVLLHAVDDSQDEPLEIEEGQVEVQILPVLEHIEKTSRAGDLYARVVEMPFHGVHDQVSAQQLVLDESVAVQLEQVVERVEQEQGPVVQEALERGVQSGLARLGRDAVRRYGRATRRYRVVARETAEKVEATRPIVEEHEARDARAHRLDRVETHARIVVVLVGQVVVQPLFYVVDLVLVFEDRRARQVRARDVKRAQVGQVVRQLGQH